MLVGDHQIVESGRFRRGRVPVLGLVLQRRWSLREIARSLRRSRQTSVCPTRTVPLLELHAFETAVHMRLQSDHVTVQF